MQGEGLGPRERHVCSQAKRSKSEGFDFFRDNSKTIRSTDLDLLPPSVHFSVCVCVCVCV